MKQHLEVSQKGLRNDLHLKIVSLLVQQLQRVGADFKAQLPNFHSGLARQISEVTSKLTITNQKVFQEIEETKEVTASLEHANRDELQQGLEWSSSDGAAELTPEKSLSYPDLIQALGMRFGASHRSEPARA